jgi:hypothetical protein
MEMEVAEDHDHEERADIKAGGSQPLGQPGQQQAKTQQQQQLEQRQPASKQGLPSGLGPKTDVLQGVTLAAQVIASEVRCLPRLPPRPPATRAYAPRGPATPQQHLQRMWRRVAQMCWLLALPGPSAPVGAR